LLWGKTERGVNVNDIDDDLVINEEAGKMPIEPRRMTR